jgi:hypothetical protein
MIRAFRTSYHQIVGAIALSDASKPRTAAASRLAASSKKPRHGHGSIKDEGHLLPAFIDQGPDLCKRGRAVALAKLANVLDSAKDFLLSPISLRGKSARYDVHAA